MNRLAISGLALALLTGGAFAQANGFAVVGVPRRKPKHFEVLGRDKGGDFIEPHVEIDGTLRKSKPIGADDAKWSQDLERAG